MAAEPKKSRGGTSRIAPTMHLCLRPLRPFASHSSLSGSPQWGQERADDEIRFLQAGHANRIEANYHP